MRWFLIAFLLTASVTPANAAEQATRGYLDPALKCLETLVEKGTDRYGEVKSPIFVSILDVETHECPPDPEPLDEAFRVIRRGRRNPAGANLLTGQPLLRTMRAASALTGDIRYERAANACADYYMAALADEKGFFWWGWHRHYDVYKDEMTGHSGNPHEIHAITCIDWPWLWSRNQRAVAREIEAIWEWHVIDKETGEINRHGDGRKGCDFSMSAGAFIEAFAFMHEATDDPVWLERASLLGNYYWDRRNPETNMVPERPNAGKDRFDGGSFVTPVTGLFSASLMQTAGMVQRPRFQDQASAYLAAYANKAYDETSGRYFGALKLDGTVIHGPRTRDDYSKYEPRGYLDLWEPYAAGYQFAIYTAQAYAEAYQTTGNETFLTAARRFADWIRSTPPGTVETEVSWYQDYARGPGRQGTYAGKYGRTISFFIHMYLLTGEDAYLADARAMAGEAIGKLYVNGLFRGHPAKPYYEAMDGVGYLLYSLLQLDQVLENPGASRGQKRIVSPAEDLLTVQNR